MPRRYTKKKSQTYDPESLPKAVSAVKNGESIRKVADRFGIPKSTLADTVKGGTNVPESPDESKPYQWK